MSRYRTDKRKYEAMSQVALWSVLPARASGGMADGRLSPDPSAKSFRRRAAQASVLGRWSYAGQGHLADSARNAASTGPSEPYCGLALMYSMNTVTASVRVVPLGLQTIST